MRDSSKKALHGGLLALLALELLVLRAEALEHGEVGAAGERLLARGDDAALDRGVGGDRLDDLRQLVDHLEVMTFIERPGMSQVDVRDAVGVGLEAEIGEVHRGLLTRAIAGQAKGSPARLV